jgi:hypothetical protein
MHFIVIDVGIAMEVVVVIKCFYMTAVFKVLKVSELSDSEWTEKLDAVPTLLVSFFIICP